MIATIARIGGDFGVIEGVKVQLDNGEAKARSACFKRRLLRRADQRGGEVDEHARLRQLARADGRQEGAVHAARESHGNGSERTQVLCECFEFILLTFVHGFAFVISMDGPIVPDGGR